MDNNEEKSSVHEEQFGEKKNNPKNTVMKEETSNQVIDVRIGEDSDSEFVNTSEIIAEKTDSEINVTDSSFQEKSIDKNDLKQIKSDVDSVELEEKELVKAEEDLDETVEEAAKTEEDSVKAGGDSDKLEEMEPIKAEEDTDEANEKKVEEILVKSVDYSTFGKEQLVSRLTLLIEERPVNEIRNDTDRIKINFYKKHRSELEQKKKQFLIEGGELKDFIPVDDPLELNLKSLLQKFKKKKTEYIKTLEADKNKNLKEKYKIINEIKDLVNREESLHKTFQEFRDLQNRWKVVGLVPQQNLKDLWETYHHHVEKFYDYVKINKELRDLDLKKNMEAKVKLCEKAEIIISESNVVNSYKTLQKYHVWWREIGPVPRENKRELWERFKEITSKINKKHYQYYQDIKDQQKKNLEDKTKLCEQIEEINKQSDIKSPRNWEKIANEIKKLQKIWRTIGFAPRKQNNDIYKRFREACDAFFLAKRNFYTEHKEVQNNNLKLKTELAVQVEELQDSEEWKQTTDVLIKLQRQWKEIGPVPRKNSEKIWKRFRAACDNFFERKSNYYSNRDEIFKENLKLKNELIEEIEKYKPVDNAEENFIKIQDFQHRWSEIGFVPFKQKDEIINKYKSVINKQFDKLDIDEFRKNKLKYKNKLEQLRESPSGGIKAKNDREKFYNKIKKLESDIVLWENNKGFFAKSKNAESLIREVDEKIDQAKENIIFLEEKIKMIDQTDLDG